MALLTLSMDLSAASNRVFVTNEKSNDVTVINGNTLEVEITLPVGERPRGIGLSPDGAELYIALSDENVIAVMDTETLKLLRRIKSGSDPETFAVHPNGNIYLSNEDDAKATVLNPATGKTVTDIQVGLEPEGVAISPDGHTVVVASESSSILHVIDANTNTIIANILVGARPRSAVFNRAGTLLFATSEISAEVTKIDMDSHTILAVGKITDAAAKPKDIVLSKDERSIYVAGGRANKVLVMDAESLAAISSIAVGKRVWGLAMSRDGKRLFTTDGVSGTVSVIDTVNNSLIKTLKVGSFPWGVVIDD
jgi:PQQ-dependent catabolism-associated beta-propeller protein